MADEQLLYEFIKREFDSMNARLDEHFKEDQAAWKQLASHAEDIHFAKRVLAGIGAVITLIATYLGLKAH